MDLARRAGIARQSLDLIFGIPGQSLAEWEADLRRAVALGTTHVSCYDLTYEPGTAMTARLRRGEFEAAAEDLEVDMYEAAARVFGDAGLERYEISNYAAPGHECRHNLAYWRQDQWLAAGPSASAHVAGHRWKNKPRLDDYLSASHDGLPPIVDHEIPDAGRARREKIMTGLRLAEGIAPESILGAPIGAAPSPSPRLREWLARFSARGLLSASDGRWRLTDAGFLLADGIAAELMAAVGD